MADENKSTKITYEQAVELAKKAGLRFPGAVAAQMGLETGWGEKQVAKNNVFNMHWDERSVKAMRDKGIKVTKSSKKIYDGDGEYYFMEFESPEDGFAGYNSFIESNPRYAKALEAKTGEEYIKEISKAGYAIDPKYSDKILNIMGEKGTPGRPKNNTAKSYSPGLLKEFGKDILDALDDTVISKMEKIESEKVSKDKKKDDLNKALEQHIKDPKSEFGKDPLEQQKKDAAELQEKGNFRPIGGDTDIDAAIKKAKEDNEAIIQKEWDDNIAKKEQEKKDAEAIKNAKSKAEGDAIKQGIIDKQNEDALASYNKDLEAFNQGFDEGTPISEKNLAYNKKSFASDLPLAALGQGALALLGLSQVDVEIPRNEEQVSDATLAFLEKNREMHLKGMPLELEAQARKDLADATKVGVDNIVRGSGGNRNLVLANLGSLDVARAAGISALNIADMEIRDAAFGRYGQTLAKIDEFESKKYNQNLKMDQAVALQKQNEGKSLANQAFAQMLNEVQYQKENGPGSMKHAYQSQMAYEMWGVVPGMKDNGLGDTPGTQSFKDAQVKKASVYNEELKAKVAEKERMDQVLGTLSDSEKAILEQGGFNRATLNTESIQSKDDLIKNYVPSELLPEGYKYADGTKPVDKDTFKDKFGQSHRMTGDKGTFFDAREKGQPGGTGLNWWDSFEDSQKAIQTNGQGPYGRDLSAMKVKVGNEWMDSDILANQYDPVDFYNPFQVAPLDKIAASNQNFGNADAYDYRKSNK